MSTLTQDFHTRLDNLLRTLVHARPHFVRCIRSNSQEEPGTFSKPIVMTQIRSLQVLETVNLMAGGKMRILLSEFLMFGKFQGIHIECDFEFLTQGTVCSRLTADFGKVKIVLVKIRRRFLIV